MTPTRRAATLALIAALAVTGLVATGPGRSDAADAPAKALITFATTDVQSIRLNVGAKAASVGDRLIFSHTLVQAGKAAGLSGVECVLTSVRKGPKPNGKKAKGKRALIATSHCVASLDLPGGQIAAQGVTPLAEPGGPFALAVTGGTGTYLGAAGTLRSEPGKGETGLLVLDLAARG